MSFPFDRYHNCPEKRAVVEKEILYLGGARSAPPRYKSLFSPLKSFFSGVYHSIENVFWGLGWSLPLIVVGTLRLISNPFLISIAISLALIPWLVRWRTSWQRWKLTTMGGALILFVVSALVGMAVTYDVRVSLPMLLTLLGSVSLFLAIVNFSVSPRHIGKILVMLACLLAFFYVGQRLSLIPAVVFTPHRNAVAGFLEGVLFLSVIITHQANDREQRLWRFSTLIIAGGLLFTGSVGAWVGILVAIGGWGMLQTKTPAQRWRVIFLGIMVGLGLAIFVAAIYLFPDLSRFIPGSTSESIRGRLALYLNSLYLLEDYPFTGVGLGDAFALVYSRYSLLIIPPFFFYAHNMFLSVTLGFGLPGLGALIWLIVSFYRLVFKVEKSGLLYGANLQLFRAAWLGTTAIFVHGLADSPHFSNYHWVMPILFVMLGLVATIGQPVIDQIKLGYNPGESTGRNYSPSIILAGLLVSLVVGTIFFHRPIIAAWYVNLGSIYQTRADLSELDPLTHDAALAMARYYFEHVLDLNPVHPAANRRLGMMALDQQDFEDAINYLERAYQQRPQNQTVLKALGLAYQWAGRPTVAAEFLGKLNQESGITAKPDVWHY